MKKQFSLVAVVLSFLLLQSPFALANNEHAEHMHKMVKELDLSKDQKDKVHAIMEKSKSEVMAKKEELRQVCKQANEEFKANTMTESKIDSYASKKEKLLGDIIRIRMMERLDISKILNPSQKSKLDGMFHKWLEKHQK